MVLVGTQTQITLHTLLMRLSKLHSKEADAYYEAVNELYDMFVEAGEHIIKNNMLHEIGVPFNLIDAVKMN